MVRILTEQLIVAQLVVKLLFVMGYGSSSPFQIEVFGVVTPCSVGAGYQRFGWPSCNHLHREDLDLGLNPRGNFKSLFQIRIRTDEFSGVFL